MSENQTIIPGVPLETPKDTGPGESASEAQAGLFENIKRAASGAYQKTVEIVKRGRGRPRADGSAKANDVVREVPVDFPPAGPEMPQSVPGPVPSPGLPGIGSETLRRCVRTAVKALLSVPNAMLHRKAAEKNLDADGILAKAMPSDAELNDLGDFGEILLRKYNVDTKYAPEAVCGVIGLGILARYAVAFSDIRKAPKRESQS